MPTTFTIDLLHIKSDFAISDHARLNQLNQILESVELIKEVFEVFGNAYLGSELAANLNMATGYMDHATEDIQEMIANIRMAGSK